MYLSGLGYVHTHWPSVSFQALVLAECRAPLSRNLKLNLIASAVAVFKRSFRQVNGISTEKVCTRRLKRFRQLQWAPSRVWLTRWPACSHRASAASQLCRNCVQVRSDLLFYQDVNTEEVMRELCAVNAFILQKNTVSFMSWWKQASSDQASVCSTTAVTHLSWLDRVLFSHSARFSPWKQSVSFLVWFWPTVSNVLCILLHLSKCYLSWGCFGRQGMLFICPSTINKQSVIPESRT